jgi:putative PIN family toxin of toxin-antitoxin system
MRVVVDTNVLYQALRNKDGASHYILQLLYKREISLAISIPVFQEYEAVLKRKTSLADLGLTAADIEHVLDFIAFVAQPYTPFFLWRPNLSDENDNMFVDLAVASNSRYIITSNISDFLHTELKFSGFASITPADFVKLWRKRHEN